MTTKKLCIFDFDGTIADSMWAWDELGSNTLNENNIKVFDDYDSVIRTMSVPNFSKYLSNRYSELGTAESLMATWHEKMVFNYLNKVPLKKGIIELLTELKNKGYILYLASATHYNVLIKAVEHFNLNKFFDFIVTEEIVGISKRDPKIYELCIERAGVTKQDTVVFEDADHAVFTAKNIGCRVCAVKDYSMRKSEQKIKDVADLYIEDFVNQKQIINFIEQ